MAYRHQPLAATADHSIPNQAWQHATSGVARAAPELPIRSSTIDGRSRHAVGVFSEWEMWAARQRFEGQLDSLWRELRGAFADDPSDDELSLLAVATIEPLIELYWPDVIDEIETMARTDQRLRRAISACDFDPHLPQVVQDRLTSIVRSEDHIG
jgi:hypothetical protein